MPSLHDGRVVLVIKSRAAEIDESDLRVLEDPDLPALFPVLLADVVLEVVAAEEQDVLRLQVSVGQAMVMKKVDREAELVGDLSHVLDGVRVVVVVFKEVEHTLALNHPLWGLRPVVGSYLAARMLCTCGRDSRTSRTSLHTCSNPSGRIWRVLSAHLSLVWLRLGTS